MYKWSVKIKVQIDDADGIIEPDVITFKYIIEDDNYSGALMTAYNDIVSAEELNYPDSMMVTDVRVRRIKKV